MRLRQDCDSRVAEREARPDHFLRMREDQVSFARLPDDWTFREEAEFCRRYLADVGCVLRLWRDTLFPSIPALAAWRRAEAEAQRVEQMRLARLAERRLAIFRRRLRPLITENYRARIVGEIPDEWFWADALALRWGMTVELTAVEARSVTAIKKGARRHG